MKILFDTSLIIAALVESHPMHIRAFPWLKEAKAKDFELVDGFQFTHTSGIVEFSELHSGPKMG